MGLRSPAHNQTNLVGRIVTSAVTATSTSITAQFENSKTGDAVTPQSDTLYFTIDKDNSRFEIIRAASHSTTNGVTTITVDTNGRDIPLSGTGEGDSSGNAHPIGAQIGCVDIHLNTEIINQWMAGTEGSSGTALRVGDETDSDIYYYAQNADANKPYIKYDKTTSTWVYADDGSSEVSLGGAGSITAGDGLTLTASDMDIDTTDTVIFVKTSSGAGDEDKVPILDASGALATGFINAGTLANYISDVTSTAAELNKLDGASANVTATNLNTLTAGSASNADALHTHSSPAISVEAAESINGSTNALPVALVRNGKDSLYLDDTNVVHFGSGLDSFENMGNADATTRRAQSFVYTNALAESITVNKVTLPLRKVAAPSDNIFVDIFDDNGGEPGSLVTNGTSDAVAGGGLVTAGNNSIVEFDFSTPPTLTSGTTYWIVFRRAGANDGTNYYTWGREGNVDSGNSATFTSSVPAWATSTNDHQYYIEFNITGGTLVQAGFTVLERRSFIGYTESNVTDGQTASVIYDGLVDSVTGLTAGDPVTIAGAAGTYTSGAGPQIYGHAISSTSLLLDKSQASYSETTLPVGSATTVDLRDVTAGQTLDMFIKTGITPTLVTTSTILNLAATDEAQHITGTADGNDFGYRVTALNTNNQYVTAASTIFNSTDAGFAVQSFDDNGFVFRFSADGTATWNAASISYRVTGK